ncbi:MAG: hypothetical protein NTV49_00875 [Kiritimatiellaeota bacterium]|nr:hypothetical protein [Kiritimatiellota bacterium]
MAWSIGDQGFDIALSSYVPKIIHAHLRGAVTAQVQRGGLALASVQRWAVHPGGRDILDKVASALGLDPEALTVSRTVLSDYGNLSSATLFFVLDAIRRAPAAVPGENICALAFGPGLTVELGLFRRPARAA